MPGTAAMPERRCAIYTRKSSEEGLEQAFNSLHAQREACAAYIASQMHQGWHLLDAAYDDRGVSGATLARPALQRLLADITARKVDLVVVYKVDRLTRSLADFARIIETFEARGVAFVSITPVGGADEVEPVADLAVHGHGSAVVGFRPAWAAD